MNLTEKEKKLLTILHEAKLVKGKLLNGYEKEIKEHFSFTYKELREALKKFLENGLLEETKLRINEVMYWHTKKVTKDMIDNSLVEIGHKQVRK